MHYLITIHYPISGFNYARGFKTATAALDYYSKAKEEAESDAAAFHHSKKRTVGAHRAQHLETMPESLFWDLSEAELQARADAEKKTA